MMLSRVNSWERKILIGSFFLGFTIRILNEIALGVFPVGYDPSVYYFYAVLCCDWDYILEAPLYLLFLMVLYFILGDIIIAIKLGSAIVVGFFLFSLTYWGLNVEKIERQNILIFSLFVFCYWISLRLAWDLHRNLLSLSFAILAIAVKNRHRPLSFIFGLLAGLSNPFALIFVYPLLFLELREDTKSSLVLGLGVGIGTAISIMGRYITGRLTVNTVISNATWFVPRLLLPLYFMWIYVPLWVIWGYFLKDYGREFILFLRRQRVELLWVLMLFIASLILRFGYRIQFLAFFPLLILTFRFASMKQPRKNLVYLVIFNIIMAVVFPVMNYYLPPHQSFRPTAPLCPFCNYMSAGAHNTAIELYKKTWGLMNRTTALIVHRRLVIDAYLAGIPLCRDARVYLVRGGETIIDILNIILNSSKYDMVLWVWFTPGNVFGEVIPQKARIILSNGSFGIYEFRIRG